MADLISAQLPDELLLDIFNQSMSEYGLIDNFLDSIATLRLTLHFHTQFSTLQEWKRRTQALLYLSRVSKSWFRVATPLLYEVIRINSPTMVFTLIRASSEAPVLLEHTKHLSFEISYTEGALQTDEPILNPSYAFKELASRCPNLWVLQNRCPDSNDDHHPTVFPSLRLYKGSSTPLSHQIKPLYNTSFCVMVELPYIITYRASPSQCCTSSILREQIGHIIRSLCRGRCQYLGNYGASSISSAFPTGSSRR